MRDRERIPSEQGRGRARLWVLSGRHVGALQRAENAYKLNDGRETGTRVAPADDTRVVQSQTSLDVLVRVEARCSDPKGGRQGDGKGGRVKR